MSTKHIASGILSVLLIGCTVVRQPILYPANDNGKATGVIQATMIGHGQGHGTLTATLPTGETLAGTYSIVFGGSTSFGSIFGAVYGPRGSASASGTSTSISVDGKGSGQGIMVGDRGTSIECEFLNANMTGHGHGACRSDSGGLYRMVY